MTLVNSNSEISLEELFANASLSSSSSFTKTRHPQYKPANESAAQRGQTLNPIEAPKPVNPTPSTNESDYDMIDSPAETITETVTETPTDESGLATSESRPNPHELSAANIHLLNLYNDESSFIERLWKRSEPTKYSGYGKRSMTRYSDETMELDEPFCPVDALLPNSGFELIGAWAMDTPKPPTS